MGENSGIQRRPAGPPQTGGAADGGNRDCRSRWLAGPVYRVRRGHHAGRVQSPPRHAAAPAGRRAPGPGGSGAGKPGDDRLPAGRCRLRRHHPPSLRPQGPGAERAGAGAATVVPADPRVSRRPGSGRLRAAGPRRRDPPVRRGRERAVRGARRPLLRRREGRLGSVRGGRACRGQATWADSCPAAQDRPGGALHGRDCRCRARRGGRGRRQPDPGGPARPSPGWPCWSRSLRSPEGWGATTG